MRPARRLQPSPQTTGCTKLAAPIAGINAVANIAEMGPNDAVSLFNLIPSRYGCKVRRGWVEWCTNVGTDGVKTIIPFKGSVAVENRLFACAGNGIYEVSATTDAPTLLETFPVADDTSGYGGWINFTTVAGKFALYTDESNGYYIWNETLDDWTKVVAGTAAGQLDGVDPAEIVGVTEYQSRVWLVRKNSALAYYLPAGLITGRVTEFNFGNKFKNGGNLAGLYTWTVDGGAGINSFLVAISTAGDVIVYQGTDPDVPGNFIKRGDWFIGQPPAGRRLTGTFGGELYLLSTYGLLPMSKLISGALIQQTEVFLTRRISPLINSSMQLSIDELGWEVRVVPTDNILLIATPKIVGQNFTQYVQSINSEGWAVYRDIPYFTGDTWQGQYYIGTSDNRVLVHTGDLDGVLFDDPDAAVQIEWSGISMFFEPGAPGSFNRTHFIRPVFMASQPPSFNVEARYDYNIAEAIAPPDAAAATGSLWDEALWDEGLWAGEFQIVQDLKGGSGMGRAIAIAINGQSGAETTLLRYDVMTDEGGLL